MNQDDEIPVLTEAVPRKGQRGLSEEQIDALCDSLATEAWILIDGLIGEALRDMEDNLRVKINDRLGDELPPLIEKTLQEKLGEPPTDSS
jgi:uncharacterized protein (DUF2267 family)